MKTQIGISETTRQTVAHTFVNDLADDNVLYIKTKDVDFIEKHTFFETHLQQLDEIIDNIAERIYY